MSSQKLVKASIRTQRAVLCLQYVTYTDNAMRSSLVPPCSPINAPQNHKMHPHGLAASVKAVCKSIPGNLWSSAWCFCIEHDCVYHVQVKRWISLMLKWSIFQNTVTYS